MSNKVRFPLACPGTIFTFEGSLVCVNSFMTNHFRDPFSLIATYRTSSCRNIRIRFNALKCYAYCLNWLSQNQNYIKFSGQNTYCLLFRGCKEKGIWIHAAEKTLSSWSSDGDSIASFSVKYRLINESEAPISSALLATRPSNVFAGFATSPRLLFLVCWWFCTAGATKRLTWTTFLILLICGAAYIKLLNTSGNWNTYFD